MSGYAGDLSDKQQHSLDELKYRLRDIWNEEFTDPFLLRWLRARDFDVNKSEKLLRDNILWRQRENIDSIIETYENPEVLRLYFPGGQCNRDREGRPFWLIRFGNADFKGMLQCVSKEALVKHVTYIVEKIIADMKAQSKKTGAAPPVEGEDASSLEAHQQWLCAESESWCLTKARLIFERMRLPANGYMC